jgi:hypothetical protein
MRFAVFETMRRLCVEADGKHRALRVGIGHPTMSTPAPSQPPEEPPKLRFLDIVVLAFSIYVLAAMLVEVSFPLSPEMRRLIEGIDVFVCLVFLTEFCLRFHRAPSKLRFMRWGWIDLLASIPVVDSLRWGRLVRLMRIIRILRGFSRGRPSSRR